MCLARGPQRSDAGEARTRGPSVSSQAQNDTVQSIITYLIITPIYFYNGIFQRDYRKMTIKWSFSYNFIVTLSPYNMIHL